MEQKQEEEKKKQKPKPTIALCAILKDELEFVREWVLYYRYIGINHFYLFDNEDKPMLKTHLKDLRSFVTVVHMPGFAKQYSAYQHFINHHSKKSDWVLFVDGDEFIVLKKKEWNTLQDMVMESTFDTAQLISFNWVYFGSNGHKRIPKRSLLASCTKRANEFDFHTKSMFRCHCLVKPKNPHVFYLNTRRWKALSPAGKVVTEHKTGSSERGYEWEGLWGTAYIAHFYTRSWQKFSRRSLRGDATGLAVMTKRDLVRTFAQIEKTSNEVEDHCLADLVPLFLPSSSS